MPDAPIGSLFETYNPQGAQGGLFAPAYIQGFAPAEKAVADWSAKNHAMTAGAIDQTRMPNAWSPPTQGITAFGGMGDRYGAGRVPSNVSFGDKRGAVDPEALRIAAQGGQYDMGARRDAIAQRVAANTAAENAYNQSRAVDPWSRFLAPVYQPYDFSAAGG